MSPTARAVYSLAAWALAPPPENRAVAVPDVSDPESM